MKQYGIKKRGIDKIRIKVETTMPSSSLKKPDWIKVKHLDADAVTQLKDRLRNNKLHTVCEEAFCPNIGECFSNGTATFMVLGDICTRRCAFCDVAHGRPLMPDPSEPERLAESVKAMGLKYVVITSVDRDDLEDGGSKHFVKCINAIRQLESNVLVEILVPDFRKCLPVALEHLSGEIPDVFNHNIETVPRLYKTVRPGSDYHHSLKLLSDFKKINPEIPTKSGIMLGLGENKEEVVAVLHDLKAHGVDLVTIGQYLQPGKHHHPVMRYVSPHEFDDLRDIAIDIGIRDVAAGPLVRSSYHADKQAKNILHS
ncbi:MAG: lipoyl synthase [Gammaproteobacteria bacterium]